METQADYETEATIAVLGSSDLIEAAVAKLREMGIPADAIRRIHPPPDIYQLLDTSLGKEVDGLLRGSAMGVPIGAALGVIAGALSGLAETAGVVLLAGLGAIMGGIVGSIVGAATAARYDDDSAARIDLRSPTSAEVVSVHTHSHRATVRARRALLKSGALALLDPTCVPSAWTQ